jgi:hypothetical protein
MKNHRTFDFKAMPGCYQIRRFCVAKCNAPSGSTGSINLLAVRDYPKPEADHWRARRTMQLRHHSTVSSSTGLPTRLSFAYAPQMIGVRSWSTDIRRREFLKDFRCTICRSCSLGPKFVKILEVGETIEARPTGNDDTE